MYISLHNHSCFSIFDGYSKIPEIVSRAKELGQHSIALTEHGTLSSVIPFYKECRKQEINPIIGNEFYMCPTVTIKDRSQLYHLILLAKTREGYHNLLKLDTIAYENVYYKPRIDIDMLKSINKGIVCLSACMGSIINTDNGEYWAKELKSIFNDDFYLEIQANLTLEQGVYNQKVIQLSKKLDIPLVITSDSHYPTKDAAKYHRYWVNLNKGENDYYPTDDFWIKSEQDIINEMCSIIPMEILRTAIDNTDKIAKQCNVDITIEGNHYPVFPVEDKRQAVVDICREGWRKKISSHVPKEKRQEYVDRYKYEMQVLEQCDYLNYLLITHDILDWCRQNDILTGIGRGSCGGSLVCYLMDITKLDPIVHNLQFERFVNPERITSADIDNDLEDVRRQDVIDYVKQKYGQVYNIRTFNYLGVKGAIQRAAQALGIEPKIAIELSKNTESFDEIQGYDELVDVARHFENLLSAYGCHASAVLVFPDNPINYCAIEKQGETYVAAYDYHDLEDMQLVKLDLLGLRNLTVIHETLRMIDTNVDIYHLPLDDHEVFQQYANGLTTGIFQTESNVMRQYAKQMKVDNFEDIAALISLVRPGPLDSGMAEQYIRGKSGEEVECLHPILGKILSKTFQVLVYQEQLTSIAREMAGYSLGEADFLRKVVGRKELSKIDAAVEEFVQRAITKGIPKDVSEEVGRVIKACGRYIFNKSHGFLYAYTSYITAYLKYHYPLYYMCSLLNSVTDDQKKSVEYISECQRMGIKVLPPNILEKNTKWIIKENSLAMSLTYLKGVGKNLCLDSIDSFVNLVASNNKRVVEALVKSGACDCYGQPRALLLSNLSNLQDILSRTEQCQQKIHENEILLSQAITDKDKRKHERQLTQWKQKLSEVQSREAVSAGTYDEIAGEIEVLGFSFREPPRVKQGKITKVFTKNDKNGREMAWLNLESPHGNFRATVFSSGWSMIKNKVSQGIQCMFIVDEKNILQEISIDGQSYKLNERRWSKHK